MVGTNRNVLVFQIQEESKNTMKLWHSNVPSAPGQDGLVPVLLVPDTPQLLASFFVLKTPQIVGCNHIFSGDDTNQVLPVLC